MNTCTEKVSSTNLKVNIYNLYPRLKANFSNCINLTQMDVSRQFIAKETYMTLKYMEKCSISFIIFKNANEN